MRPGGGFIPAFPLTEKIEVNGINEHPLYSFLKVCFLLVLPVIHIYVVSSNTNNEIEILNMNCTGHIGL